MACMKKRRGRWVLDFYDQHGVRQRETLPKGITKTKARDELRDREERVSKGLYVSERKALPFKEVAAEWLEYKKPRIRETTWEVTEGMVRNHFHDLNELKITRITTADIEKYITAKQEAGVHILTLRKILVTLGQIMAYAVRHRYLEYNPYREAEKPRDQRTREKEINILIPSQIRAFLEAEEDQKHKILFLTAIMTGARQGELLGLKWEDLDLEKNQIFIRRTFTKGRFFPTKTKGSKRKIDLPPSVIFELKKWKLACPKTELGLIFPNEAGEPTNYSNLVQRHFFPALEKAGIIEIETIKQKLEGTRKTKTTKKINGRRFRFHDLRHTYASLLIEQGENIKYIQSMLGHSSPVVTLTVYAHLMKPTNQEAVQRLEKTIFEANFETTGHNLVTKKEKDLSVTA
jgi:integrase